ncbi:hypothetical protein LJ207_00110 [Halanaerobium sp. Z-7514]|uniref:Type IV pilus assembly protein PilO n=1 Tax=Halanaerobium polyolivorans TaxID=2886943 RepID=A0AAW4WRJ0_9FIRM|nr:hypothetical protein [Halanaerobium polyolivorans]MCC3143728.1 hypothetical protein [Halanaerobium polyolivorans]RQD78514.1 MAG: hypothetical protein D5S01_01300 [Halanaerobium sp. MSAO_Bac5]
MLKNLSRREKVLLLLVFIIAVGAIYYFYFYTPLTEEIAALERRRDERNNRLNVAISYAERLPEIKAEYLAILDELAERGVYVEKDRIDLLIDYREAAKDNDLKLALFRPQMQENAIAMSIEIQGGFREVVNLLEDFKDWNYWFEFREVNIGRHEDGVQISMNTLYHDRLVDPELLRLGVEADE